MDNVREILEQARAATRRIQRLTARYDFYREAAEKATSSFEAVRVSGTGNRSRVEESVVKMADIQTDLADELARSRDVLRLAGAWVNWLYGRYHEVLSARYLERLSWDEIADKLGYDKRWLHRLHGYALLELGKRVFEEQG